MRTTSWLCALSIGFLSALPAGAVGTRHFVLSRPSDFRGGDLEGVAIDGLGHLRPGFNLGTQTVSEATNVFSALTLKDGTLLLGTGNEGKLLGVTAGKVQVLASTKALVITSLVEGFGGAVFLGTLPDGKIFRFQQGKLTEFASIKGAEHIWQLAYDAKNKALYAATGPDGKLYRVDANGQAQVYFDAPEQHLMSVAVGPDGSVYAGASDKARLYKISGPGRASVLYDFARTEVRAIAVSRKGEVFAIANDISTQSVPTRRGGSGDNAPAGPASTPSRAKGKGVLMVFGPDGSADELLDNTDEHLTSLALGDDGRPYVGSGVDGHLYTVDANHNVVLLADVEERQVGALVMTGRDRYLVGSDPLVVHPVRGVGGAEAVWTSKVLDAGIRAHFGWARWEGSGRVEVSTRSGNSKEPDETWSGWSNALAAPGATQSPPGRFLQVRARFSGGADTWLSDLDIAFRTDNLRATVTDVGIKGADDDDGTGIQGSGGPISRKSETTVSLTWKVDNPDKDELRYRLQYQLLGSNIWFDMLKPREKLTKESYNWETADLPEGRYRVRVIATDELANPPNAATRDELSSGVVLVDNTPPVVENLKLVGRHLQGVASDGVGPIARIEAALAGTEEWFPFFPSDGVFDERREEFDLDLTIPVQSAPAMIALRVYDQAGNYVVRQVALR